LVLFLDLRRLDFIFLERLLRVLFLFFLFEPPAVSSPSAVTSARAAFASISFTFASKPLGAAPSEDNCSAASSESSSEEDDISLIWALLQASFSAFVAPERPARARAKFLSRSSGCVRSVDDGRLPVDGLLALSLFDDGRLPVDGLLAPVLFGNTGTYVCFEDGLLVEDELLPLRAGCKRAE
jgi:hypothetical protein